MMPCPTHKNFKGNEIIIIRRQSGDTPYCVRCVIECIDKNVAPLKVKQGEATLDKPTLNIEKIESMNDLRMSCGVGTSYSMKISDGNRRS